jgi:protein tyrosine phosphatase (PTP) superfamily phosphohydrolase (DUF442 family)
LVRIFVLITIALLAQPVAAAADLADASNYREYSERFASSGQPTAAQLENAAELGFERIVYLAFTDDGTAIEREDSIVKELGMEYIHIPVDFGNPTVDDFKAFARIMAGNDVPKTLLHCQVNFRASTFSFLYRTIILHVSMLDAKEDLDSVWVPNEIWFRFIRSVFEDYEMSHACDGCDWGENEFIDD